MNPSLKESWNRLDAAIDRALWRCDRWRRRALWSFGLLMASVAVHLLVIAWWVTR